MYKHSIDFLSLKNYRNKKTNFFDADNAKFRRKIVPGETLEIKAVLKEFKKGLAKGYAEGYVKGEFACSAEFVITVPDIFNKFLPKNRNLSDEVTDFIIQYLKSKNIQTFLLQAGALVFK